LTETDLEVHFKRITSQTVLDVCRLSATLSPLHRKMVADNSVSLAEAYCSQAAWPRAIYAGDTLVGFIMLHIGSGYDDGIDCPGVFLWRLMIAGPHQGKGYGWKAMELLFEDLRALGVRELYTSCEVGEGSPEGFYRNLGFTPTGGMYGHEIELVRKIAP
jgi:diamine N-acetyltransferase